MQRGWMQGIVLSATIVASMVVGGVLAVNLTKNDTGSATVEATATTSDVPIAATSVAATTPLAGEAPAAVTTAIENLPDLVSQVGPSVVRIETVTSQGGFNADGVGSGVVIDRDGHILTNNHVVDGATSLNVQQRCSAPTPATTSR
jgi:putative serine protease PepD